MMQKKTDVPFDETYEEQEITDIRDKRTIWDRIPKYKWWVTPLNILLICLFLVVIDIFTLPNTAPHRIDWAWWPVGGLIFAYVVSFIVFKRTEIAWIIGPILMIGTSGLLLALDLVFPPNDGLLHLDWAIIPIAALLTFGVFIPIITKFGRKKEKPIEKFRKAITELDVHEDKKLIK
ncbi:MAG: hypothetical protein JXA54_08325 [Candidatus Heimdallarchaeota archaeon]|nr:hypothetical protein [Candidatus Heimdallarchaeota archaeon]